jgi:hypothetical protein
VIAAANQLSTVDQTAVCEVGRHHRCRGLIVSLSIAHGSPCDCPCHDLD